MSDCLTEYDLPLADAVALLPRCRQGRPPSVSCLTRWARRGVRTAGGVIRLAAVRLGGRWLTSRAALTEFLDALTAVGAEPEAPKGRKRRRVPA